MPRTTSSRTDGINAPTVVGNKAEPWKRTVRPGAHRWSGLRPAAVVPAPRSPKSRPAPAVAHCGELAAEQEEAELHRVGPAVPDSRAQQSRDAGDWLSSWLRGTMKALVGSGRRGGSEDGDAIAVLECEGPHQPAPSPPRPRQREDPTATPRNKGSARNTEDNWRADQKHRVREIGNRSLAFGPPPTCFGTSFIGARSPPEGSGTPRPSA